MYCDQSYEGQIQNTVGNRMAIDVLLISGKLF